jgi:hypothetical protein
MDGSPASYANDKRNRFQLASVAIAAEIARDGELVLPGARGL